jgi:hypothetical protein
MSRLKRCGEDRTWIAITNGLLAAVDFRFNEGSLGETSIPICSAD